LPINNCAVLFFVVTPRDHNTTAVGYYIYTVNNEKIQGSPKRKATLVHGCTFKTPVKYVIEKIYRN